jgi:hypothetical protein
MMQTDPQVTVTDSYAFFPLSASCARAHVRGNAELRVTKRNRNRLSEVQA